MNYLFLHKNELTSPTHAHVTSARAIELHSRHDLKQGTEIRIVVEETGHGTATVTKVNDQNIEFSLNLKEEENRLPNTSLIVGISRPQTLKKVLQFSATIGLANVHLVRTSEAEKSYFDAHILQDNELLPTLRKGAEQSGALTLPKVNIHRKFLPFVEDELPKEMNSAIGLLADTQETKNPVPSSISKDKHVFLAIGPESGWSTHEVERFKSVGFISVSLGQHIMRVEDATTWLVAQVDHARAATP